MAVCIWIFSLFALATQAFGQTTNNCPPLYLRYSRRHTYCKPDNPSCKILRSSVTQKDMEVILNQHNTLRSKVAVGNEHNLPTAADMMQMVWDDELAAVAQKHASQCEYAHDCSNCRRVQNFGVGQNLAKGVVSNSPNMPNANWPSAIKSWYDEVQYFDSKYINPFMPSRSEPTYGHFTQVAWAKTWRIGCGYALYSEDNTYTQLYTCNYGPGGNIDKQVMYKVGPVCSACPLNSCCGKSCGANTFAGLCKMDGNSAPKYPTQETYIFYCSFEDEPDCNNYVEGLNKWKIYNTLSGNYLGILLEGGETSTLVFKKSVKPTSSKFCFVINYRKGPNVDGKETAHSAVEIFTIKSNNFESKQNLPNFGGSARHQFSKFSMALGWNMETEVKLQFSVPAGKPQQFFEVDNVYAKEGAC